jgi:hypothetical protein
MREFSKFIYIYRKLSIIKKCETLLSTQEDPEARDDCLRWLKH